MGVLKLLAYSYKRYTLVRFLIIKASLFSNLQPNYFFYSTEKLMMFSNTKIDNLSNFSVIMESRVRFLLCLVKIK